jgi:hypothetical protein
MWTMKNYTTSWIHKATARYNSQLSDSMLAHLNTGAAEREPQDRRHAKQVQKEAG